MRRASTGEVGTEYGQNAAENRKEVCRYEAPVDRPHGTAKVLHVHPRRRMRTGAYCDDRERGVTYPCCSPSSAGAPLERQRVDFLLLFSDRRRVVIELDGKQHYAKGDQASPALYARLVAEDRRLKLAGYEVFRFGGAELFDRDSRQALLLFFDRLAERVK